MKKKVLLIGVLAAVAFTACKKKSNVIPPTPQTTDSGDHHHHDVDTSITIAGISDMHMDIYGFTSLPLTINRNSGIEEKVTLSITGAPQGIETKFLPASGYASFSSRLEARSYFTRYGIYPVKITSTRESGKTRTYDVNIVVDTPSKKECDQIKQFYDIKPPFADKKRSLAPSINSNAAGR